LSLRLAWGSWVGSWQGERMTRGERRGKPRKAARLSSLLQIRAALVSQASRTGRYPERIADVVTDKWLLAQVGVNEVDYQAAGKTYPLGTYGIIFTEKGPTRYGPESGGFYIFEGAYHFYDLKVE